MGVGVVTVAAVRIGGVTVRLDVGGVGALEPCRARGKLKRGTGWLDDFTRVEDLARTTYAGSIASSDVVGKARNVAGITHEDGGGDLGLSGRRDGDSGAAQTLIGISATAVGIVEDLATLTYGINSHTSQIRCFSDLGVSNED